MAETYIVKQGDYLAKIADDFGFESYKAIWDYPENAGLKKKRQNPSVLFPGDELIIPDKQDKQEDGATEQRHRFQLTTPKLRLRLRLEDLYFRPIANAQCELRVDGELHKLVSDNAGQIEQEIPVTAEQGELLITDGETPLRDVHLKLEIGSLDPVEELAGQTARLSNLGYYLGALDGAAEKRFRSAVEEFQCDNKLGVDGVCGPKTQAKLKEVHGC